MFYFLEYEMKIKFSIQAVLVVTAIFALVTSPWIGNLCFLLVLQLAIILFMADTLTGNLPAALLKSSRDNYMRIDGSVSSHRRSKEHAARRKVRLDMLASMLGVAIVGNCLLGVVHTFVMPLGLMPKIASAFDTNPTEWKRELRRQRIDHAAASAISSRGTRAADDHLRALWKGWPMLLIAGVGFVAASCGVLRFAYLRSLEDFRQGVVARAEKYMQLDMTRMAHHEEKMVPSSLL